MSKYVNVKVSAIVYTDFYIEVPDDAIEDEIKKLAEQETILPHNYPYVLDEHLRKTINLHVRGMDSMFKAWDVEDVNYIIDDPNILYDGGDNKALEGE